jgi:hypothetical protein
MKAHVFTTGIVLVLLALAHVARVIVEGAYVLKETIFVVTTVVSIGMFGWAIFLFKKLIAK